VRMKYKKGVLNSCFMNWKIRNKTRNFLHEKPYFYLGYFKHIGTQ
jgi:hypothetical protein